MTPPSAATDSFDSGNLPSIRATLDGGWWWVFFVFNGALMWSSRVTTRSPVLIIGSWASLTAYIGGSVLGHLLDGITSGIIWLFVRLIILSWWGIAVAGAVLLPLRLAIVPLLVVRRNIASRRWSLATTADVAENPVLSRYIDHLVFHLTVFGAFYYGIWERRIIVPSSTIFTVVRIDHPSVWYSTIIVIGSGLIAGASNMTAEELAVSPVVLSFRAWKRVCERIDELEAKWDQTQTNTSSNDNDEVEENEGADWEQVTTCG